ncbi:MAG: Type 1 glutamine amidotransferase-like domain-containing protein [Dehalococcoidales bacterium]
MTQITRPVFLLAGGRHSRSSKPDPLLQAVFRGFGIASPSVAYSGTASGDDKSFFSFIAGSFTAAGAGKVTHAMIAPDGADLKKAQKILEAADIVFISGGDVEAGMEVLQAKNLVGFFNDLYRRGKPFFGISAGAIMLATKWVRWTDPNDNSSAEFFPCLGYAPVICDTHDEQGGWEELQAALMLEKAGVKGYGLASGSGVRVKPDGGVEAVGGTVYQYLRRAGGVERLEDILPRATA